MSLKMIVFLVLLLGLSALVWYLFRPLRHTPVPADFNCMSIEDGRFESLDSLPLPAHIFGMGLTYSQHILETASEFSPEAPPPIFMKKNQSLTTDGATVTLPDREALIQAAGEADPGLPEVLRRDFPNLGPLLDYEVELGFVLLESVSATALQDENFVPKLGFLLANDLSARSIALLGEGTSDKYEYWGLSKSFPGFLPVSSQVWIPNSHQPNGIPCVTLETRVNGAVRQSQSTSDMIYTPAQMLRFIYQKYPDLSLQKGDMVLMGTPGGVAIKTPAALVRFSNLIGLSRFQKLSIKLKGDQKPFLKKGDRIEISGEGLGKVTTLL